MKIRTIWPALAVALAGCVHTPTAEDGLSYEQHRTQLENLESWHMSGRIAVDTGERAYQGRFQWRQHGDSVEFLVRGPIGVGLMQIKGPMNS